MHLLSQVRLGMDLTKVNKQPSLFHNLSFFPYNFCLQSIFVILKGRLADIYLGAEVVAGNVCRFLCTPGFVCKVMLVISCIDLTYVLPYGLMILMRWMMTAPLSFLSSLTVAKLFFFFNQKRNIFRTSSTRIFLFSEIKVWFILASWLFQTVNLNKLVKKSSLNCESLYVVFFCRKINAVLSNLISYVLYLGTFC